MMPSYCFRKMDGNTAGFIEKHDSEPLFLRRFRRTRQYGSEAPSDIERRYTGGCSSI
jgi:hypothetical protein